MASSLHELSQRLLACGGEALLDAPLDQLGSRCADADVAALLAALHEAGEADTLRDALGQGGLARWAEETCTPREEESLAAELRRWLGMGQRGGDDPVRLARVEPVPENEAALRAWAERYGVGVELERPVGALFSEHLDPHVTLGDACLGRARGVARSLLDDAQAQHLARHHLHALAAQREAFSARTRLWQRKRPDGALRTLSERLWAACVERLGQAQVFEHTLAALHPVRFVPAQPAELDPRTGVCRARVLTEADAPALVQLYLSGFEQRALEGRCTQCAEPACLHVRALAGRLFDACLDPEDRLHANLEAFARVPSWQRFLQAVTASEAKRPRAKARVCFAVRVAGERVSVGALAQKAAEGERWSSGKLAPPQRLLREPACSDQDRPVLEALLAQHRTLAAAYVLADLPTLRALVEHPRVRRAEDGSPLSVREQSVEVELLEQPDGLLPQVRLAGVTVQASEQKGEQSYLIHEDAETGVLTFAALSPALRRLLAALAHFRGVLPKESHAALAPWLSSLRSHAQVSTPKVLIGTETAPPEKLLLRITPGIGEGIVVHLTMRALPLGTPWLPGQGPELVYGLSGGEQVFTRRKLAWERAHAQRVIEALDLSTYVRIEAFAYHIETNQQALEVLARAARLSDELEIEWADGERKLRLVDSVRPQNLTIGLFKRGAFLELTGGAHVAGADVALGKLLDAARRGERFVPIRGGDYVEIEAALFARLEEAQICAIDLKVPRAAAAAAPCLLSALGELAEAHDDPTRAWLRSLEEQATPPALDETWLPVLRAYQQEGARWLLSRSAWARGACLADEMGLGKTLQAIVLLSQRASLGPAMVVAPTSLVENWLMELARFAPHLRGLCYRGAKRRALSSALEAGSVLVTSYETLLRDRAHFDGRAFATQVIDEAQVVKNARTQRAQAVSGIDAAFRLALSGTPVENRLGDLWSLFHLLEPDLLGSWSRFRARFAVPIERYESRERAATLRSLVSPLILRRTKEEVETELPARTEVVHMVELSPPEQDLYQAAVRRARRALGKRKRDEAARTVQILAEITRLRQLACHPRLVLKDPRAESSKLYALLGILDDILPRGHRALIFSQFTQYLALVREALDRRGLRYLYLDGSTPAAQRAGLVSRFQADEAPLFLISLKAGGTGLNLTAADYVLHLDPWWNPAAEDQASDRVHRLGQQRPVTVIKLVAQGTIEEKVLALHEHKRRLARSVLVGQPDALELDQDALERLIGR